ncbi:MAG: hypothetical protein ACQEXJ_12330 [Myxococcota bacterium]
MRLRPDFHETFLLNLLDARQPELLATRRAVALDMLQHVSPERLRSLFTPAVAQVLLDVTRLGALEMEADDGVWDDDQLARLVRVRRELSAMAAAAGSADSTSCLLPDGARWVPMHLMRTENPWPRLGGLSVLIDHARQRVDGVGEDLRELVAIHGGDPHSFFVARTRFGLDGESLRGAWSFGATTAVRVASRASGSALPRWAAIGMNAPMADLDALPMDVRLLVLRKRRGVPRGIDAWEPFIGGAREDALRAWSDGKRVCFMVETAAEAAECVLTFREASEVCGWDVPVPRSAPPSEPARYAGRLREVAQR